MKTLLRAGLIAAALTLTGTAASAQSYNVATHFGAPVFSYGSGNGGSTFNPFGPITTCGTNLRCAGPGAPDFLKNDGTTPHYSSTLIVQPGTLHTHTGPSTDSILRFTAAIAGNYDISGAWTREDVTTRGDGTIGRIYLGSTLLSSTIITTTSYNVANSFTLTSIALNVGDTLDFVLNNNGSYDYDSTALAATISLPTVAAVPEPATWAMMIGGFGMAGGAMRRKRRAALRFA